MTEQDYIDYFTQLATQNKAIRHTPDVPRLYVIHDNNYDELTKALSKKLRLPAVLLDQYYDDIDRTQDNPRLVVTGGLSVLLKCDTGNLAEVRRVRAEARAIARQFINRMFTHSRTPGSPLYQPGVRIVTVSTLFRGEPFDDLPGYAGWGYPFEWTMAQDVAVVDADWTDLTPDPLPTEPEPAPAPPVPIAQD